MKGNIYLAPITLGESNIQSVIPQEVISKIITLRHFIVEDIRTVRRYLRRLDVSFPIDSCQFFELNKHTSPTELASFLIPAENGSDMAISSEAGVPGIADPGADVVALAHKKKITVVPMVGPSSILMAMMASGLNGQNFAFNGYLPIKPAERIKALKHFEKRSQTENQSQLFIETPYRNRALLADILANCLPATRLTIAADISLLSEFIRTDTLQNWKNHLPEIDKRPSIFILHG